MARHVAKELKLSSDIAKGLEHDLREALIKTVKCRGKVQERDSKRTLLAKEHS